MTDEKANGPATNASLALIGAAIALGAFVAGGAVVWFVQSAATRTEAVAATQFENWRLDCPHDGEKQKPCRLAQDILDPKTNFPVARLNMILDRDHKVMEITVPDNIMLQPGLGLMVGEENPRAYPFAVCNLVNCVAYAPMDPKLTAALRAGQEGRLLVMSADQKGEAYIFSLQGFAEGDRAFDDAEARRISWWRRLWS